MTEKRILLLMHRWVGYVHGIQLGIAEYFEQRPEWIWRQVLPTADLTVKLSAAKPHGIIAYVEEGYLSDLRRLNVPVVDVSNWLIERAFPSVLPDDSAIGHLAATYLLDLGLQRFGTIGPSQAAFSQTREAAFAESIRKEGFMVERIHESRRPPPGGATAPEGVDPRLFAWLHEIPKPAGVFATTDNMAAEVLQACRIGGVQVPEQVCVLGVDNDELTARVTHPPLSSVALPTQKIGFEAGRLLDQLMSGAPPPAAPVLLPPVGVVARQSTNLLAIADPDVLTAVRFIREQVHRQVKVRDVLASVLVNRRYLERKFRETLGRTPLQEIRRARVEKAKELLSGTDLTMPVVARRSGFPNPERLANVFRAATGMTPTGYRRKFRIQEL